MIIQVGSENMYRYSLIKTIPQLEPTSTAIYLKNQEQLRLLRKKEISMCFMLLLLLDKCPQAKSKIINIQKEANVFKQMAQMTNNSFVRLSLQWQVLVLQKVSKVKFGCFYVRFWNWGTYNLTIRNTRRMNQRMLANLAKVIKKSWRNYQNS